MWIFSTLGFFSVVQKRPNELHIRARKRSDLEKLRQAADEFRGRRFLGKIADTPDGDYCARIVTTPELWIDVYAPALFLSIDYCNFKSEIGATADQRDKLPVLHRIWSVMADYQEELGFPPYGRPSLYSVDDPIRGKEEQDG